MFKKLLIAVAVAGMLGSVFGADNLFPSIKPPANIKPAAMPMYVVLGWDDVGYSGLKETTYEPKAGEVKWADICRVGGTFKGKTAKNDLNIQEADMGGSWAVRKLLQKGTNPDGSKIGMSMYIIAGQMNAITWETAWIADPKVGQVKGWMGESFITTDWSDQTLKKTVRAPVCWGREYPVLINGGKEVEEQGHIKKLYDEIKTIGFEIGSHTLDHMETNSGVPKKYWPNGGEGFDPGVGKDTSFATGKVVVEATGAWDTIGWDVDAGRKISIACWDSALGFADQALRDSLKLTPGTNLFGFRAPRLECNGNLMFALQKRKYVYDCSLEEIAELKAGEYGKEDPLPSTDSYYPYTFDNGSPSQWHIQDAGERSPFTNYPLGFWEAPIGIFIVPVADREQVYAHAKSINDACKPPDDMEPYDVWKLHGTITGYDFNMFVLWGMDEGQITRTLKYNLDLRIKGNKAPLTLGIHCDYFTPMYDFATLLSESNKASYGQIVDKGWNNYKTRIKCLDEFVKYAKSQKCNFVSTMDLITEMKKLQAKGEALYKQGGLTAPEWTFYKSDGTATTSTVATAVGSITNAKISVAADDDYCGYDAYEDEGYYSGMEAIEFTYKSSSALKLQLLFEADSTWEVLLNNPGQEVKSGKIPISAFRYSPYSLGTNQAPPMDKCIGISISIAIPNHTTAKEVTLDIKDVILYGARDVGIVPNIVAKTNGISLSKISNNQLKLNLGAKSIYTINVVAANGKIVRSFKDVQLNAGVNTLPLNSISSGAYILKISSKVASATIKATVM